MAGCFCHKLKICYSRTSAIHNVGRYFTSLTRPAPLHLPALPSSSSPWLLLPPDIEDNNFFNIVDKSLVKINRPKIPNKSELNELIGTTRGWLAFTNDSYDTILTYPYLESHSIELKPLEKNFYGRSFFHPTMALHSHASEGFVMMSLSKYGYEYNNLFICRHKHLPSEWEEYDKYPPLAYSRKTNTAYQLCWKKSGPLEINCWDVFVDGNRPKLINTICVGNSFENGTGLISSVIDATKRWEHEKYLVMGAEECYDSPFPGYALSPASEKPLHH